jgi:tRNA 2-selenouridine synthase
MEVEVLLGRRAESPLLDVRSPGEYCQGHIPGAVSFPLFSDEERAVVGTLYKQEGKDAAMERGLDIVGPKLGQFVREAKQLAPGRKLMVHCWRGGQRSGSMAWLLRQAGFEVDTLAGGYKSYRKFVLEGFESLTFKLVVLGGKTGTGKTKILKSLAELGEQVIDLEGLAHHKGSAFGFIGEAPQPTVEQFENNLFDQLFMLDARKRVWLENESHSIGRIYIPEAFWRHMRSAPLLNINIPETERLKNLVSDYVLTAPEELAMAFQKIDKKLGGLNYKTALELLQSRDYEGAAQIALQYYDKTYQHGIDTSCSIALQHIAFEFSDSGKIAQELTKLPDFS